MPGGSFDSLRMTGMEKVQKNNSNDYSRPYFKYLPLSFLYVCSPWVLE